MQFDIKTAFLYGELQEEIFTEVPEGIRSIGSKMDVLLLLKAIETGRTLFEYEVHACP